MQPRTLQTNPHVQPFGVPSPFDGPTKLPLDAQLGQPGAESGRVRRSAEVRPVAFAPVDHQVVAAALNRDFDLALLNQQRTIFGRIGRQFAQHQRDRRRPAITIRSNCEKA